MSNLRFLSLKYPRIFHSFQLKNQIHTSCKKPVMITTPIFYVNAAPHIGHLYSALLADSLSRWYKLCKKETLFTTGTDEHGLKVQQAAVNAGKDYLPFCDDVSSSFRQIFDKANIEYDDFIRTTEVRHVKNVQNFWTTIEKNGHIYLGEHRSWYCQSDESFLTDLQVYDVLDEATGKKKKVSMESGHEVVKLCEENYKFRLSSFQEPLLKWLKSNPNIITPKERYNEVISTIENGLHDVSVSRLREKIQWAIDVPNDKDHAIYVWMDALANYLTCSNSFSHTTHKSKAWPADYQIVGKDILKFHAIYWPAFLMAANMELPKRIVAHAHWTVGKVKMSKSLGNVIDPIELIDQYGLDSIRYFLLREGGMSNDGDFSFETLETKINSELANTLGNLVSRSTADSLRPTFEVPLCKETTKEDERFIESMKNLKNSVQKSFEEPNFQQALSTIMEFLYETNRYFNLKEPWNLSKYLKNSQVKDNTWYNHEDKLHTTLYLTYEALRISVILLQHIMPESTCKILDHLGVPKTERYVEDATFKTSSTLNISSKKFVSFKKYT